MESTHPVDRREPRGNASVTMDSAESGHSYGYANRLLVCTLAVSPFVSACDRPTATRHHAATQTDRTFAPALTDTVWTALLPSGEASSPAVVVADDRIVYVGDPITSNVIALDVATGARRWETRSSRDSAVSHFSPRQLSARRRGGVFAVDGNTGSLLVLSSQGVLERRIAFDTPKQVDSVCELPDGRLLVSLAGANGSLITTTDSGRVLGAHALPWSDLQQKSWLLSAVRLAPTSGGCLAALVYGRGFTPFDGSKFRDPMPYVESVALPEVHEERRATINGFVVSTSLGEHVGGATDVAVTPSAIVTSFGGHTDDRNHLVDVYDPQGRYLESFRTRRAVSALTANDSLLFLLTHRAGEPIVVALRWKRQDLTRTASTR